MTSRERVYRTLDFGSPDRAPRELWRLGGIALHRSDELRTVLSRFPEDVDCPPSPYGPSARAQGSPSVVGSYIDEWGCTWSVGEPGVIGEVKSPPLADWSAMDGFSAPYEILSNADFSNINAYCRASERFIKASTGVRPFERMQFIRGTENLLLDFLIQPSELFTLRDMVHQFFLREMELWATTEIDAIQFMDDWGSQGNLLIDPDMWRSLFKPMYRDYCNIAKSAGKRVFFHSDGCIREIIPDLIEIGVDSLNSQLFCMDIEELGREFQGKITFWGEICRQHVLPFGTVDEVRAAVRRVRSALDRGTGGVMAQCEWGNQDPMENILAVFETWLE